MSIEKSEYQFNGIKDIDELLKKISSKKIIVYPAGKLGQQLQKTLSEYSIDVTYFIDRAYENLKSINGVDVYSPDLLKDMDTSQFQVIISVNLDTQFEQLKQAVTEKNSKLQIFDGWALNRRLKMPLCKSRTEDNKIINIFECENCGFERHHCPVASACLKDMGNHRDIENDERSRSFDWFGYIVSQKCTLRCEHCCEQIPLLKDKGFAPIKSILADVKKIADSSYFLNFVELIGGEPFLHPDIEELIEGLLEIDNIGYIKSFTNGTVIPSARLCEIMKSPRFMLQVSNYEKTTSGRLLDNILATREKLNEHKVPFLFTPNFEWLDFKDFEKHDVENDYLKNAFDNCFLKNCHRVYKGKLYRCPHHYAGIQLGKIGEHTHECIDIHSHDSENLGPVLEKFEHLPFIDACRFCELAFDPVPVPAGIQLPRSDQKNRN